MNNILNTDILLLFNYNKNDVVGYVGYAAFAELEFAINLNKIFNKNIEIYIYQMPDKSVNCYDEINLWLKLGWIRLWQK